ncbi:hypothetical protein G4V62_14855, partial [Bacillaceae bacterium SIJ1]|uniref:hypothetical protein n=1 Tax=Litoribacterium kuwaitense TaxID=1398745 RepID=UPI0013EE1D14
METEFEKVYGLSLTSATGEWFIGEKGRYLFAPVAHLNKAERKNLQQLLTTNLQSLSGATPIPAANKRWIVRVNGNEGILFQTSTHFPVTTEQGRELASFQNHASVVPASSGALNILGKWPQLWGTRLDAVSEQQSTAMDWCWKALGENAIALANDAWMDTTSQQQDVAVLSRRSYDVSSPYFFCQSIGYLITPYVILLNIFDHGYLQSLSKQI